MTTPEFVDKVMQLNLVHIVWYGNLETSILVLYGMGYAELGCLWVPRNLMGEHLEMLLQLVEIKAPIALRKGEEIQTKLQRDCPGVELKHMLILAPMGCSEFELRRFGDEMFQTHPEDINPPQLTMERGQYLLEISVKYKVKEGTEGGKRKRTNPITRRSKTTRSLDVRVKA